MENIPNNKTETPLKHYRELYSKLDAGETALRTGAELCDGGGFVIELLGHRLHAGYPDFKLTALSEHCPPVLLDPSVEILLMRFLIRGKRTAWLGQFKSYRELPWGDVYDSNFNGRCRLRLAFGFGNRLGDFEKAAVRLGGTISAKKEGSVTADLPLSGGVTARLILHEGDDEFPPAAQILFSDNVISVWDAEDLAGMGEIIISALKQSNI